jgi:hypothetical protein
VKYVTEAYAYVLAFVVANPKTAATALLAVSAAFLVFGIL